MNQIQLNRIQYKFWMDNLLKFPSVEYNNTNYTFVVEDKVCLDVLKQAYFYIMLEYPPLCSVIKVKSGNPFFVCGELECSVPFMVVEEDSDVTIGDQISHYVHIPFNLESDFPCRFYAIHKEHHYYLVHVFHHLVMDGLSFQTFFDRLGEVYYELLTNTFHLKSQFELLSSFDTIYERNFVEHQQSDVAYWKEYIQDVPLSLSFPKVKKEESESGAFHFNLGSDVHNEVVKLSNRFNITLFRLYSVIWALTLAKCTSTPQLLLDHTLNLRPKKAKELFGTFVNNLPMKFDFKDGDLSVLGILDSLNRDLNAEKRHLFAFYHQIFHASNSGGTQTQGGINVSISYPTKYKSMNLELYGCKVKQYGHVDVEISQGVALLIEDDDELNCVIRYGNQISRQQISTLAAVFKVILKQVLNDPTIKLRDLELLSYDDKQRILALENIRMNEAESPQTFFSRFHEVVRLYGKQTAVECEGKRFSYEQLDTLSNRVAGHLQKMGLYKSRIGLSSVKSVDVIIAILGILKSGNIYVPIDYTLPIERIRFLIDDCGLSIVLGSANVCLSMVKEISIYNLEDLLVDETSQFNVVNVDAQEEAYVIYTSGTTGKPKAIPICHFMLNQMIVNTIKILELSERSRVSQFANISFDGSIYEIFPVLNVGGCLILPTDAERKDPQLYHSFLSNKRISISYVPPVLLASLPHTYLPDLKIVVVAGDITSQETIDFWSANYHLLNSYGPTENSVSTTYTFLTPTSMPNDIGVPESGVSCYVLDKFHKLLPDNVMGELYIGGVKLSKGYINRPTLNKEKFIPNPFKSVDDVESGRNRFIYQTGDLAIRTAEGHYLFMGRSDFQIKLNGYRIELGDVETQIGEYDSQIKGAIVVLYENENRKQLVAYIQVADIEGFPIEKLRRYLTAHLPVYMVPSVIIPMKSFPCNANGKIDRKCLPDPSYYHRVESNIIRPETATEKRLAHIWSILLLGQEVGRDDDFISLGGDSLAIIHMTFNIEEDFGITMKVSEIYQNPTLRELATCIDLKLLETEKLGVDDQVAESESDVHVPLSPTQMSLWLQCIQSKQIKDVYNLPCIFNCPETMELGRFQRAFNKLVQIQDAFRITFPTGEDGKPYIHVADYQPITIPVYSIKEQELPTCLQADLNVTFDLSNGPLFHVKLYQIESSRICCSLVMHHLISDGWSASLIESLITRFVSGNEINWDQYKGNYLDYAKQSNDYLHTSAYQHRLTYWKNSLTEAVDLEILCPTNGRHTDIQGNVCISKLQEELGSKVKEYCKKNGFTLFDFYITIYLLLLSRLSGQTNFAIGFPYLGREKREYNQVLGYFVHTLPLCCRSSYYQLTFEQCITEVRKQIVNAQENSIALEEIIKLARATTGNSDLLLIQTMFTMEEERSNYGVSSESDKPFDLTFTGVLTDDNVVFRVAYRYACFSEDQIKSLINAYMSMVEAVIVTPDLNVLDYPLISEANIDEIRNSNVCVGRIADSPLPFLDLFERTVKQIPNKLAVSYNDLSFTYRELDEESDKMMRYIQSLGIAQSSRIAVNMVPSIQTIVTIMAILKSGCVYVPIDVELTEQRRRFILQDASCAMYFNDDNYPLGELLQLELPSGELSPERIVYIIYTSGTTGIPKGVPITGLSLSYMIASIRDAYELSTVSRYMLFSSISFDVSVLEIFTTLAVGATLVIAPKEVRKDQNRLANFLQEQRITCASIPPAMVLLLPKIKLPLLKTLIVGGESSADAVMKFWAKEHKLINAYGPTENTVVSTLCVVNQNFETNDIGLPLPGVTCYVLDKQLNMVPNNTRGDLYIGGVQLTPGYLNRPELNQEKFIENPFVLPQDKERGFNTVLYKSGDIVIRRSNGHLIFMGRSDRQVKLRGFRIELSDIECHLMQCVGVERAVVKIQKGNNGDELIAFIQSEQEVNPIDLQESLRLQLPGYMIPTKWTVMKKFPLTVNGKTDWKNVPEPQIVMKNAIVGPETEDERLVLTLVSDIMGTNVVGVETDLLDAGMTSLQVMEFVASTTNCPHLRFTIPSVYRNRTVRKILQDQGSKLYFWAKPYDSTKPILVLICGFGYYEPFYNRFIDYFNDKFNIFVFESFREYFREKTDVSTEALLDYYLQVIKSLLHQSPVYAITGYCIGSELAIRLASLLQSNEMGLPKVLMMEGVLDRTGSKEVNCAVIGNSDPGAGSFELLPELFKTYPKIDFQGDLIIALALHPSRKVTTASEKEYDDETYKRLEAHVFQNMIDWEQAYPNSPFLKMEAEHLNFFERDSLDRIWNAMRKYWNLIEQ